MSELHDPVPKAPTRTRLRILAGTMRHGHRVLSFAVLFLAVLLGVTGVVTCLAPKGMIDGVGDRDWATTIGWAIAGMAAAGVSGSCLRLYENVRDWMAAVTGAEVNIETVRQTREIPGIEHLERPEYAHQVALIRTSGSKLLLSAFALLDLVSLTLRIVGGAVLLAFVYLPLAIVPLCMVPPMLLVSRVQRRMHRTEFLVANELRTADHLHEIFSRPSAMMEMKVFGAIDALDERADRSWERVGALRFRGAVGCAMVSACGWPLVALGYTAALFVTAWRISEGTATVGDLFLVAQTILQLRGNTTAVAATVRQAMDGFRLADRYAWLAQYTADACTGRQAGGPAPESLTKGISLTKVTFGYPGAARPSLVDVDLTLASGTTVAIVGLNGAGKTSLVKLLCGFYAPTSGEIRVDGTSLADIDPAAWYSKVSGCYQDFLRLETSARYSVGVGDPQAMDQDDRVEEALRKGDAYELSRSWEQGLDQHLGTTYAAGVELSGGQWQRVAIARAMMQNAPLLLVLDEPTAALDPVAEHRLYEKYESAAGDVRAAGGVVVLVSHRFSSVRMADQIVVMEHGRVVAVGAHDELMLTCGIYADMYSRQSQAFTSDPTVARQRSS